MGDRKMARKENFSFLSSDGKTKIHAVRWSPDSGEYQAVFQIVHGMVEFIERYSDFANYLTEQGFLVVGHDHLGHGASVVTKEDWGYIAKEQGSSCMVRDIHKLRIMTERKNPDIPYFILGHSMGSYLVRKYITKYGEHLSGVIIVGTGTVPEKVCNFGMKLLKAMARFLGWHYRNPLLEKLFFFGPFNEFDMDGSNPQNSWLTKDIEIVKKYYSDERCTFKFTVNGYYNLLQTIAYDSRRKNIEKIPKALPIFLLSGDRDPVGNFGKGVRKVERQLKKAGIRDLSCKLYRNSRHEILNELDRKNVYEDIVKWCENRI